MDAAVRAHLIRRIIGVGFIASIALSWALWQNERLFPLMPLWQGMPVLPAPLDMVLLGILLLGLVALVFSAHPWVARTVLVAGLLMGLQDQMRWQPWVYTYLLLLIPFAAGAQPGKNKKATEPMSPEGVLLYTQIFLIGLYFWSGLHKFNANFSEVIYPLFVKGIFNAPDGHWLYEAKALGYFIPVTELLVGLGLIFRRTRKVAAVGAALTHLIIAYYLSPLGLNDNHVVLPWNLAMIAIALLATFGVDNPISFSASKTKVYSPVLIALAVLVWFMPSLNTVKKWDHYLSFNLYTENIEHLYVSVREASVSQLDPRLKAYFTQQEVMEEAQTIDVSNWAFKELGVPVYPEKRIFDGVSRYFCALEIPPDQMRFIAYQRPLRPGKYRVFNCQ